MIQRSKERGDDDVHVKLQAILDSQGENSSVECHKTCYCTYTSKQNVAKYIAKKRKEDFSTTESEPETSRVRRSQLPTFQLKKHCLICGDDCLPKDPKHPDRWERIIQCETSDHPGLTPFKDVHALSGCDTVSYPFNKGKISALNALQAGDFPGLFEVLGEEDATDVDLMETGQRFFAAMYGQPPGTSMNVARYQIYSRKQGKPMRIMALPPTETNLFLHVRRAHLQMMLWKAADQQGPPHVDITQFGWEVNAGIPSPSFDTDPPAPPGLIDVISCGCKAEGKACSTEACSCHGNNMSCTIYCTCSASDECCNPFTISVDADDNGEGPQVEDDSEGDEEGDG